MGPGIDEEKDEGLSMAEARASGQFEFTEWTSGWASQAFALRWTARSKKAVRFVKSNKGPEIWIDNLTGNGAKHESE